MSLPSIFVINPPSITDNRPPSIIHWHKKLFYKHTFKVLHFIHFDESESFAKAKKKILHGAVVTSYWSEMISWSNNATLKSKQMGASTDLNQKIHRDLYVLHRPFIENAKVWREKLRTVFCKRLAYLKQRFIFDS